MKWREETSTTHEVEPVSSPGTLHVPAVAERRSTASSMDAAQLRATLNGSPGVSASPHALGPAPPNAPGDFSDFLAASGSLQATSSAATSSGKAAKKSATASEDGKKKSKKANNKRASSAAAAAAAALDEDSDDAVAGLAGAPAAASRASMKPVKASTGMPIQSVNDLDLGRSSLDAFLADDDSDEAPVRGKGGKAAAAPRASVRPATFGLGPDSDSDDAVAGMGASTRGVGRAAAVARTSRKSSSTAAALFPEDEDDELDSPVAAAASKRAPAKPNGKPSDKPAAPSAGKKSADGAASGKGHRKSASASKAASAAALPTPSPAAPSTSLSSSGFEMLSLFDVPSPGTAAAAVSVQPGTKVAHPAAAPARDDVD
ncbi:MAG: hypothetical protein EOO41_05080, partial [Methanobacteriota archaeon]